MLSSFEFKQIVAKLLKVFESRSWNTAIRYNMSRFSIVTFGFSILKRRQQYNKKNEFVEILRRKSKKRTSHESRLTFRKKKVPIRRCFNRFPRGKDDFFLLFLIEITAAVCAIISSGFWNYNEISQLYCSFYHNSRRILDHGCGQNVKPQF